jgi:hypothetical protein
VPQGDARKRGPTASPGGASFDGDETVRIERQQDVVTLRWRRHWLVRGGLRRRITRRVCGCTGGLDALVRCANRGPISGLSIPSTGNWASTARRAPGKCLARRFAMEPGRRAVRARPALRAGRTALVEGQAVLILEAHGDGDRAFGRPDFLFRGRHGADTAVGPIGISPFKILEKLDGAGGFEPPNGGIKIRCLATWLRPTGIGGGRLAIKRRPGNHAARPRSAIATMRPGAAYGRRQSSG